MYISDPMPNLIYICLEKIKNQLKTHAENVYFSIYNVVKIVVKLFFHAPRVSTNVFQTHFSLTN